MIKFVVWGTGGRGKVAIEIFGTDRIVSFIDSNPHKIGKKFYGKPIVDLSCYKTRYSDYAILISLANDQTIVNILKKENTYFYT